MDKSQARMQGSPTQRHAQGRNTSRRHRLRLALHSPPIR